MTKKKVVLSAMTILACGLLAACSKGDGGTDVTTQGTKNDVSVETTTQESAKKDKKSDKKSDDKVYEKAGTPWRVYYPADVVTDFDYSCLFTYDVENYMVTAYCTNNAVEGDIESNVADGITSALSPFKLYCIPSLDTSSHPVSDDGSDGDYEHKMYKGDELVTHISGLEGEHIEVNGIDVYKFTARIDAKDVEPARDCYLYGYSWQYLTPEGYQDAGKILQYTIVGVVSASDEETYKADMEGLTDYIMNHWEMVK